MNASIVIKVTNQVYNTWYWAIANTTLQTISFTIYRIIHFICKSCENNKHLNSSFDSKIETRTEMNRAEMKFSSIRPTLK
uniref:Uncharacterized protein n=1 Tax=Tetranychus urticae TaxID=32264 RepID=T1KFJ2_TETUR